MNGRIVIVEDDESIRTLLEVTLKSQGYVVAGFSNAVDALKDMVADVPRCVIMDIMMDGMDGVEAVRRMRQNGALKAVPVIMLTAKDTELDKILGLDAGADDYIAKPFSVLELCARVRAQLRRLARNSADVYACGDIRMDVAAHLAYLSGAVINLTMKEYDLLKVLMENHGRVMGRQELLERVWGFDFFGESRTLDMHIGSLRQKLRDNPENSRYIKTVRGVGYRFDG